MSAINTFRTSLPLSAGAVIAAAGVVVTAATHGAVLTGRLPHTAVSGGRLTDASRARWVALGSLLAQIPVAVLVVRAAGARASAVERRAFAALAVGCLASVPLQLTGTRFERQVMAPTASALALGCARLAAGGRDDAEPRR